MTMSTAKSFCELFYSFAKVDETYRPDVEPFHSFLMLLKQLCPHWYTAECHQTQRKCYFFDCTDGSLLQLFVNEREEVESLQAYDLSEGAHRFEAISRNN